MASKPIHEYDAKLLLSYWLPRAPTVSKNVSVSPDAVYPSVKVAQLKHEEGVGLTGEQSLPGWVRISLFCTLKIRGETNTRTPTGLQHTSRR